ncbi:MAG: hypothetical protein M3388_19070 [Acidobacteriota bacterium]|nr:hypothetical protein [Acidobacteriota bacterium]
MNDERKANFLTHHSSFLIHHLMTMSQDSSVNANRQSLFAALRRFVRLRVVVEHCNMCNAELAASLKSRKLKAEITSRNL